jgi:nucleotide-binding universal stress UspA family protein
MRKRSTVPIDVVYREGRAAQQIAEYCREAGIDLAVMCTHGRGGFSRFWLGSTADGLLRQLAVPTLLIRGTRGTARSTPSDVSFPRILVPLDRSPHAEAAMHAAIAFAGETAVTLTLLSVIHPMTAVSDTGFPTQAEREYCAQYLEPLAERYRHEGRAIEVETEVTADVAQAIIDHANRHASSLIALATQGLGGVQRFVIGSVADKLIRTAPMPVLVVP